MHCRGILFLAVTLLVSPAWADTAQRVVDIPTRPGVTQRFVLLTPEKPMAAVVLFAGGHGGLQINNNGAFGWGGGNFLVRSRDKFADQGLVVAVVDAPSDRQRPPYLSGYRQTDEHVADIQAVIAWLRKETNLPVWLVGTSRGTQSVGYLATAIPAPAGPDGIVLTASILEDRNSRAVPEMPLDKLDMPVLVVHHEEDGCNKCRFSDMSKLMTKLGKLERKELLSFKGGRNEGDPCEARAYHGFNGLEPEVVARIAGWLNTENIRLAQRKTGKKTN